MIEPTEIESMEETTSSSNSNEQSDSEVSYEETIPDDNVDLGGLEEFGKSFEFDKE